MTFQLGLDAQPETVDASDRPWAERWGYVAEDEAFVAACRGESPVLAGAEAAERAVAVVDACYRSAASGEAVRLA